MTLHTSSEQKLKKAGKMVPVGGVAFVCIWILNKDIGQVAFSSTLGLISSLNGMLYAILVITAGFGGIGLSIIWEDGIVRTHTGSGPILNPPSVVVGFSLGLLPMIGGVLFLIRQIYFFFLLIFYLINGATIVSKGTLVYTGENGMIVMEKIGVSPEEKEIVSPVNGPSRKFVQLGLAANGQDVYALGYNGKLYHWNTSKGIKTFLDFSLPDYLTVSEVGPIHISPDQSRLLMSVGDGVLIVPTDGGASYPIDLVDIDDRTETHLYGWSEDGEWIYLALDTQLFKFNWSDIQQPSGSHSERYVLKSSLQLIKRISKQMDGEIGPYAKGIVSTSLNTGKISSLDSKTFSIYNLTNGTNSKKMDGCPLGWTSDGESLVYLDENYMLASYEVEHGYQVALIHQPNNQELREFLEYCNNAAWVP